METTLKVEIHLIIKPDLEKYGEIPPSAPRTTEAVKQAEKKLWVGEPAGAWTSDVLRQHADGPIDPDALVQAVETRVREFEMIYNAAEREQELTLQLASIGETGLYYYRDDTQYWCTHHWNLLASPAEGTSGPEAWILPSLVQYEDEFGKLVEKPLDLQIAFSAKFSVDWFGGVE